jgi:hypothetical protein
VVVWAGQSRIFGARHPTQDLFGQRWPVVWLTRFVPDQPQRTGEPVLAQHGRGAESGQRGTDDNDATTAFETVPAFAQIGNLLACGLSCQWWQPNAA